MAAYADGTYASCKTDRRSVSGSVITYAGGQCVGSLGRNVVSVFVHEAEYVSLADCTEEVLSLQQVLGFMSPREKVKQVIVHEDNEGPIHLANNPLRSAQSKHIDVRYDLIHNEVREGRIATTHIRSGNQCADSVRRHLPQEAFEGHSRYTLGIWRHG